MNEDRQDLEQIIIGSCLLENGYARVAGVLTSKNFTASNTYNNQAIFKAIEALYPNSPIDIITVNNKVNKPYYAHYLASCSSRVSSIANIRYHAFLLLQLSMRDVLIEKLNTTNGKEFSISTKATINEIIDECLDHSNDILDIYDKVPIHLKNLNTEESLIKEFTNLKNDLYEKAIRIKKQAHIDCLFNNLQILSEVTLDSKSKLCMTHLINVIKGILVTEGIDNKTAKKILDI